MKKLYVIIPIVLLGIFIAFFLTARNEIRAKEKAKLEQQEREREERRLKAEEARREAYKEAERQALAAIAAIEAKNKEKERQNAIREEATNARSLAYQERNDLRKHASDLVTELSAAKAQKAEVERLLKIQKTQVDYLKTATKEVLQNKTQFETAIQKINEAERAFAAAEKARKEAATAGRRAAE